MKTHLLKFLSIVFISMLIVSCSSNEEEKMTSEMTTQALYKGTFVSNAHPTSGSVTINQDKTVLNFTDFMSDSGPDLDIYLVADLANVKANFINLGDIKGLKGDYTYNLPIGTDYSVYKYVMVWCVDFDVNFGYATLVKQ